MNTDHLGPLYHYSDEPLGELVPVTCQRPRFGQPGWGFCDKPQGLWVSVNDEWEQWCRSNDFGLHRLAIKHQIVLKANSPRQLLLLQTPEDILLFQGMHGTPQDRLVDWHAIHWDEVADQYAGIVIAPYQWSLRLRLIWYYGWDCASGCIWDTSIISKVEPVTAATGAST